MDGGRPVIIVSNDLCNKHSPVIEVVCLTTRPKKMLPTHVKIQSGRLPSIALCEQVISISKIRLLNFVGRITPKEMRRIDAALTISLGINQTEPLYENLPEPPKKEENEMHISLKTPFGELNLEMPKEKVLELTQVAVSFASGVPDPKPTPEMKAEVKVGGEQHVSPADKGEKPETAESAAIAGKVDSEKRRVTPSQPATNDTVSPPVVVSSPARSRVERLFGNFKTNQEDTAENRNGDSDEEEARAYKGFILAECEACGQIKGFCAKNYTSEHRCVCGHSTTLKNMRRAYPRCQCGATFRYHSNIRGSKFEYSCLQCGAPIDMELNKKKNVFVPVECIL